ncbi:MAG: OB-fold domain-containing protein [Myxococcota bacterium]|jgi:uncharacterized protein|nr:OB-fold domain-containing protein [Myxococcota bacterium]
MTDSSPVHAAKDLFVETSDGPRLLGSRCDTCKAPYFPSSEACHNPDCDHSDIQPAHFGPHGTLWSVTVQNYPPPPPVVAPEPYSPYAVGLVDLETDGLRVIGRLHVEDPTSVKVGGPVELILAPLGSGQDGHEVISWQFEPR